jgi:hypothetical protein
VIITGPYEVIHGSIYAGNIRIALMDRNEEQTKPVDRDDTVYLLAASWDLLEAAESAQACLGDLVRGRVASDNELEAYEMLKSATEKATRRWQCPE